jgi:hypothetical protein
MDEDQDIQQVGERKPAVRHGERNDPDDGRSDFEEPGEAVVDVDR